MPELPESQLPQEPEYWDGLADKIRMDAARPLAAYAGRGEGWDGMLARRAPWLVAASVAAMLVLWLTLPERGPSVAFRWIEGSLTPSELAGTLVSGAAPPTIDTLMIQFPPSEEEQR